MEELFNIKNISLIIMVACAFLSVQAYYNTKELNKKIVKNNVSIIISEIRKLQTNFNIAYSNHNITEIIKLLTEIDGRIDMLYFSYQQIDDSKMISKINETKNAIAKAQKQSTSIWSYGHIADDLNKALDELYASY